ncbi:MAG: hypothetical protein COX41_02090, partial [Candidatus Omnitrophica bacterium CG23_combo_of_CG06-09_8_20_14_all_41_10]
MVRTTLPAMQVGSLVGAISSSSIVNSATPAISPQISRWFTLGGKSYLEGNGIGSSILFHAPPVALAKSLLSRLISASKARGKLGILVIVLSSLAIAIRSTVSLFKRLADAQSVTFGDEEKGQDARDASSNTSNIGNTAVEAVSNTDSRVMPGNSIGNKIARIISRITDAQSANSIPTENSSSPVNIDLYQVLHDLTVPRSRLLSRDPNALNGRTYQNEQERADDNWYLAEELVYREVDKSLRSPADNNARTDFNAEAELNELNRFSAELESNTGNGVKVLDEVIGQQLEKGKVALAHILRSNKELREQFYENKREINARIVDRNFDTLVTGQKEVKEEIRRSNDIQRILLDTDLRELILNKIKEVIRDFKGAKNLEEVAVEVIEWFKRGGTRKESRTTKIFDLAKLLNEKEGQEVKKEKVESYVVDLIKVLVLSEQAKEELVREKERARESEGIKAKADKAINTSEKAINVSENVLKPLARRAQRKIECTPFTLGLLMDGAGESAAGDRLSNTLLRRRNDGMKNSSKDVVENSEGKVLLYSFDKDGIENTPLDQLKKLSNKLVLLDAVAVGVREHHASLIINIDRDVNGTYFDLAEDNYDGEATAQRRVYVKDLKTEKVYAFGMRSDKNKIESLGGKVSNDNLEDIEGATSNTGSNGGTGSTGGAQGTGTGAAAAGKGTGPSGKGKGAGKGKGGKKGSGRDLDSDVNNKNGTSSLYLGDINNIGKKQAMLGALSVRAPPMDDSTSSSPAVDIKNILSNINNAYITTGIFVFASLVLPVQSFAANLTNNILNVTEGDTWGHIVAKNFMKAGEKLWGENGRAIETWRQIKGIDQSYSAMDHINAGQTIDVSRIVEASKPAAPVLPPAAPATSGRKPGVVTQTVITPDFFTSHPWVILAIAGVAAIILSVIAIKAYRSYMARKTEQKENKSIKLEPKIEGEERIEEETARLAREEEERRAVEEKARLEKEEAARKTAEAETKRVAEGQAQIPEVESKEQKLDDSKDRRNSIISNAVLSLLSFSLAIYIPIAWVEPTIMGSLLILGSSILSIRGLRKINNILKGKGTAQDREAEGIENEEIIIQDKEFDFEPNLSSGSYLGPEVDFVEEGAVRQEGADENQGKVKFGAVEQEALRVAMILDIISDIVKKPEDLEIYQKDVNEKVRKAAEVRYQELLAAQEEAVRNAKAASHFCFDNEGNVVVGGLGNSAEKDEKTLGKSIRAERRTAREKEARLTALVISTEAKKDEPVVSAKDEKIVDVTSDALKGVKLGHEVDIENIANDSSVPQDKFGSKE